MKTQRTINPFLNSRIHYLAIPPLLTSIAFTGLLLLNAIFFKFALQPSHDSKTASFVYIQLALLGSIAIITLSFLLYRYLYIRKRHNSRLDRSRLLTSEEAKLIPSELRQDLSDHNIEVRIDELTANLDGLTVSSKIGGNSLVVLSDNQLSDLMDGDEEIRSELIHELGHVVNHDMISVHFFNDLHKTFATIFSIVFVAILFQRMIALQLSDAVLILFFVFQAVLGFYYSNAFLRFVSEDSSERAANEFAEKKYGIVRRDPHLTLKNEVFAVIAFVMSIAFFVFLANSISAIVDSASSIPESIRLSLVAVLQPTLLFAPCWVVVLWIQRMINSRGRATRKIFLIAGPALFCSALISIGLFGHFPLVLVSKFASAELPVRRSDWPHPFQVVLFQSLALLPLIATFSGSLLITSHYFKSLSITALIFHALPFVLLATASIISIIIPQVDHFLITATLVAINVATLLFSQKLPLIRASSRILVFCFVIYFIAVCVFPRAGTYIERNRTFKMRQMATSGNLNELAKFAISSAENSPHDPSMQFNATLMIMGYLDANIVSPQVENQMRDKIQQMLENGLDSPLLISRQMRAQLQLLLADNHYSKGSEADIQTANEIISSLEIKDASGRILLDTEMEYGLKLLRIMIDYQQKKSDTFSTTVKFCEKYESDNDRFLICYVQSKELRSILDLQQQINPSLSNSIKQKSLSQLIKEAKGLEDVSSRQRYADMLKLKLLLELQKLQLKKQKMLKRDP